MLRVGCADLSSELINFVFVFPHAVYMIYIVINLQFAGGIVRVRVCACTSRCMHYVDL